MWICSVKLITVEFSAAELEPDVPVIGFLFVSSATSTVDANSPGWES